MANDPKVQEIMRMQLPEKQSQVEGTFFKDQAFPEDTLRVLTRHPLITLFEAEHAIYTTDITNDVESLLKFIFSTHENLTGKFQNKYYSISSDED